MHMEGQLSDICTKRELVQIPNLCGRFGPLDYVQSPETEKFRV
jgi:hypothetical protein